MWEYNHTPEPNELMHYGIKGQKWGLRRYQNKDGTLTPAGKKRYADDSGADQVPRRYQRRYERRLRNAGEEMGRARYEHEMGKNAKASLDEKAARLDRIGNAAAEKGRAIRAEMYMNRASKIRKKGERLKDNRELNAKEHDRKAAELKREASEYATKKKITFGKNTVKKILRDAADEGYNKQRDDEKQEARERTEEILKYISDIGRKVYDAARENDD